MNLRRLELLLLSPFAVFAFVFRTFSSIWCVSPLLTWLYHLYHGYKLLRMNWSNVERKTDEFKTSGIAVAVAVAMIAFILSSFLPVLLFISFLEWFDIMLIETLMNLECLVSLSTSPSLAVAAGPCVYDYAWVIRSSVFVCCLPESVLPSASVSTMSMSVPGLSAPPSLYLWLCLDCPLLCLCLLCAWVRFSVCVYVCCVYSCAQFVGFSIYIYCLYLCLGCLLILFNFFIVSLN